MYCDGSTVGHTSDCALTEYVTTARLSQGIKKLARALTKPGQVTFPCHAFWISPYGHSLWYGLPNGVIVHHTHDLTSGVSLYTICRLPFLFFFCICLSPARVSLQNRYLSPRKSKTAFLSTFGFVASTEKACIWNVVVVLTSSKDEDKSLPWYVLSDSQNLQ